MSVESFKIQSMSRSELDIAVEWAADEGWNPGIYDADCFFAADPNGFLIGMLKDKPVAVISVVKYNSNFGFLGFFIVKPEYRGKGYGLKIWNEGMKYLKGCNVGLDGVTAQQDNYRKSGFELAHQNIRYEGRGPGSVEMPKGIVGLNEISLEEISEYDQRFFGQERTSFLSKWINQPESRGYAIKSDLHLNGYGVIRKCRNGYKIGPLFAENPVIAGKLFVALSSGIPEDQALYLDIPAVNASALDLVNKFGMKAVFNTARMYTKSIPKLPLDKIFGISSFELG